MSAPQRCRVPNHPCLLLLDWYRVSLYTCVPWRPSLLVWFLSFLIHACPAGHALRSGVSCQGHMYMYAFMYRVPRLPPTQTRSGSVRSGIPHFGDCYPVPRPGPFVRRFGLFVRGPFVRRFGPFVRRFGPFVRGPFVRRLVPKAPQNRAQNLAKKRSSGLLSWL